ncbi:peptide-methionine (R)-S-oxide reductase MsrB [Chlorogloeopsis fritschii PCC 9212]|nr:peptide-methionine (R)-S-oxide reductase MsrB [Chlorogloeopsis fritschii]
MKRRHLLTTAAATVSAVGLSSYLTRRTQVMATSNTEKFEVNKTEEEWRQTLTPEQFRVLRKHGTERAGTSPLDKNYAKGTYVCAGCGQPLFTSETKFNSGTGWPSFYAPIEGAIATSVDKSFFMTRVEVHCSRCGGHLGHVFNDGPAPTGKRYCMNGVAMEFTPQA